MLDGQLAGGAPVRPGAGAEDVRHRAGAHRGLRDAPNGGNAGAGAGAAPGEGGAAAPERGQGQGPAWSGKKVERKVLWQTTGVDLTRIDGISVGTARTIVTEVGPDVSAFPTRGTS